MAVAAPLLPRSAAAEDEDGESLGSASSSSSPSSSSEMDDGDAAESSSPGGGDVGKSELQISPLFEISCLMAQLPIKRGLSRHFDGKSQSFASLSDVKCVMDLAKKTSNDRQPYCSSRKKRIKPAASRSFAGGLDCLSPTFSSRTITKKSSRSSSSSSLPYCSSSSSAAPKRQQECFRPPLPSPLTPPPPQQQIIMNSDGFPEAGQRQPCPLYA